MLRGYKLRGPREGNNDPKSPWTQLTNASTSPSGYPDQNVQYHPTIHTGLYYQAVANQITVAAVGPGSTCLPTAAESALNGIAGQLKIGKQTK
jgi:hypothetical protein